MYKSGVIFDFLLVPRTAMIKSKINTKADNPRVTIGYEVKINSPALTTVASNDRKITVLVNFFFSVRMIDWETFVSKSSSSPCA